MMTHLRVLFADGSELSHPLPEVDDINRVWSWLNEAFAKTHRDEWMRAEITVSEEQK